MFCWVKPTVNIEGSKLFASSKNQSSLYLHPQTQHSPQPYSNNSANFKQYRSHSAIRQPRHQTVLLRPKYQASKTQLTCQLSTTKLLEMFSSLLWDMGNILYNLKKKKLRQAKNSQHLLQANIHDKKWLFFFFTKKQTLVKVSQSALCNTSSIKYFEPN